MIQAALTRTAELIKEESSGLADQCKYGIDVFDELTWTQRLALLDCVATFLLTDTPHTLDLNAVNEAAIGALFEQIRNELEWEMYQTIDRMPSVNQRWRDLIRAAHHECSCGIVDDPPWTTDQWSAARGPDHIPWSHIIETLVDRILWDRDYEMADGFLDQSPESARFLKTYLGIDENYFAVAAPDADSPAAIEATYRRLGVLPAR